MFGGVTGQIEPANAWTRHGDPIIRAIPFNNDPCRDRVMQPGSPFHIHSSSRMGFARVRVGLDLVEVSRVRSSMQHFGQRFLKRLFSDDEVQYAKLGNDACAERLAARFAAKEAAIKAFALADVGVNWRDIEVCKQADGGCQLVLHGRAAAQAVQLGVTAIALSLSHDGDYAGAVVTALCDGAAVESGFPS